MSSNKHALNARNLSVILLTFLYLVVSGSNIFFIPKLSRCKVYAHEIAVKKQTDNALLILRADKTFVDDKKSLKTALANVSCRVKRTSFCFQTTLPASNLYTVVNYSSRIYYYLLNRALRI